MESIAFQIPDKISLKQADNFQGTFTFKPLEKGYGTTIGNALRRVLLSSLEGYAITSVKVPGIYHEFSTIQGVTEDLVEIVLNLKQVRLKKTIESAENKIFMAISKKKVLKAGDLHQSTSSFEITNPDLIICHIDENARFEMELNIGKGHGYIPAEENRKEGDEKGIIPIDSIFSPIIKVDYHVENTRVGQKTDYESLILSIQTDGTIHPQAAIEAASSMLISHFSLLIDKNKIVEAKEANDFSMLNTQELQKRKLLNTTIDELHRKDYIDKRIYNCLKAHGIDTVARITELNANEIKDIKNMGEKSIRKLKDFLISKGLKLENEEEIAPAKKN